MRSPCCLCISPFLVFYAVRVVWKEIGRLFLRRTSYFELKQRFGDSIPPPSSGKEPIQLGPIDRASPCLRTAWSANEDLHMDANFICCRHKRRNTRALNDTKSSSRYDVYIPIHQKDSYSAGAAYSSVSSPSHIVKARLMECRCTAEARQRFVPGLPPASTELFFVFGIMFLRNVELSPTYMALQPRKPYSF
jgi:hypothetical protein